jgi:DNA-binding GntR family transcriptional regulator
MQVQNHIDIVEQKENQPINQWVYEVLWANIIELHLEPGGPLSEIDVAERLGVSRTPVREAFIKLVKDGLLHVIPQKGSIVSRIDLEQADEARFVRRSVEKAVLAQACGGFPTDAVKELEASIARQRSYFQDKDFDQFLAEDNDFHRIVYRGCGKERIWLTVIKKLDFNYDRLRVMALPHMSRNVVDEHEEIIEIITKKDSDRIDGIIERHLTWAVIRKAVSEYPTRFFVEKSSGRAPARDLPHSRITRV